MTVRFYGKTLQIWENDGQLIQMEKAYTDYDIETGEIKATGSEDFSPMRWVYETEDRWVWTWDGKKRNRGGHRWFEQHNLMQYRRNDRKLVKEYFKNKYNAELVELR